MAKNKWLKKGISIVLAVALLCVMTPEMGRIQKVSAAEENEDISSVAEYVGSNAAIAEDGSLWVWDSNNLQKIMEDVKAASVWTCEKSGVALKKDGSLWL